MGGRAAGRSRYSGRQIEIGHAEQRAVVVEVGGGLRTFEVAGRAVLDGYGYNAMCDGGRGQPLLPWPNRLADGEYTFEGQELRLPIDDMVRRNAMHGLTRWLAWTVAEQATDRVRMALAIYPRPGYPFLLELSIEYALGPQGLRVTTTAANSGDRALPFGAGQHPYLSVGTERIDSAVFELGAHSRLELDDLRRLPTGRVLPADAAQAFDFRRPRAIGPLELDDCFTDLQRGADGLARVCLSDPASEREVSLWMDASYPYVQVFTGDTLAPEKRRRGLAVEPMTCPPNAFRTGTDVIALQPGESRSLAWGLSAAG